MKILFVVGLIIALGTSASADNAQRILRVERLLREFNLAFSDCVRHDIRFQKCQGYGTVTAIIDAQSSIICIQNTNLALNYGTGQEIYGYPCMLPYSSRVTPREQTRSYSLLELKEITFKRMQRNLYGEDVYPTKFTACDDFSRSSPEPYTCETTEGNLIYFLLPEEPLTSNTSSRLACSYHRGFASAKGYGSNIVGRFTPEELNDICSREAIRYGLFNQ